MTFAIVDDSADDREALKKQLLPYLTQNHFSAEITEFENAEEFLLAASQKTFSVVFLDIYMKEKTGMDVAQELFNSGCNSKLIFLSSSTDFFRQSYAVHAVYYLVKPIVPEEFRLAMQFLKLRPEYDVPFLEIVHNNVSRTIPTEPHHDHLHAGGNHSPLRPFSGAGGKTGTGRTVSPLHPWYSREYAAHTGYGEKCILPAK